MYAIRSYYEAMNLKVTTGALIGDVFKDGPADIV